MRLGLVNITFLSRSGYFTQFQAKKVIHWHLHVHDSWWCDKHFSVQTWISFNFEEIFFVNWPPFLWGKGVGKWFLCISGQFIQFLAIFCKLISPIPMRARSLQTLLFSADLDISYNPTKKFDFDVEPTPWQWGFTNMTCLHSSGYFM